MCARGVHVDFIDLNFLSRDNETAVIQKFYNKLSDHTVVFSFVIGDNLSDISTNKLKMILGEKLVTFSNIRFDGLHPDMTYIGPFGARRQGFFSDYHSKLVISSFFSGRSERDCARLFDPIVYDKLGYFSAFSNSSQILLERDKYCDVKFAGNFLSMLANVPSLYSFNHPTGAVFLAMCSKFCSYADLKFVNVPNEFGLNELSNSYVWPIFDCIAERNNLKYRTPDYFIGSQSFVSRSLTLNEFISGCYAAYRQCDQNDMFEILSKKEFFSRYREVVG